MHVLTGNQKVDFISQLRFEGNITPNSWYQHIRYKNKRGTYTDHLAIAILADVVYWYRATEIRDETTGATIGFRKKFKANKLQRSYKALSENLGASIEQVKKSCSLLVSLNLISLSFETVHRENDTALGNVMFIDINPKRIAEITYRQDLKKKEDTLSVNSPTPIGEFTDRYQSNDPDITEISTKNSSETSISTVTHTQVLRDRAKSSESVNEEKNAKPEEVDPGDSLRCQQNKEPVVQKRKSICETKNSGAARRKVESLRVREEKSVTIRNKVNDQGWLVMDRKSCFKMARAIASRRLILVLGELCGIKYQVGTDEGLVGILGNGSTIHIDEAIGKGKQADLLFLRRCAVSEQRFISQGQYNYLLEKLFESSVEWLLTQPHVDHFDSRFIYERFFKRDRVILSRH